jgi:hypothetical protein
MPDLADARHELAPQLWDLVVPLALAIPPLRAYNWTSPKLSEEIHPHDV